MGHIVTPFRIEANLEKNTGGNQHEKTNNYEGCVEPRQYVGSPKKVLSQISRTILAILPVNEEPYGKIRIRWIKETDDAFNRLKKHLRTLPMLANPKANESLVMYLSTNWEAISVVLIAEQEKK